MKTLEQIKNEFEDKTVGGYDINILAYHPEQEFSIIVEVWNGEVWEVTSFRSCGKVSDDYYITWNLVKKKRVLTVLPKDVLCSIVGGGITRKLYSDGMGNFYKNSGDSFSGGGEVLTTRHYKIIKNPVRHWFGGECPIPQGVKFKIYFRNKSVGEGGKGSTAVWLHNEANPYEDIIAYQILGEEQ